MSDTLYNQTLTRDKVLVMDAASASSLPEHLYALPGTTQWALWRTVCLRGAGFPASDVHKLETLACTATADAALDAEEAVARAQQKALEEVNGQLDVLRQTAGWDDKAQRAPLVTVLQTLKMGKMPKPIEHQPAVNAAVEALQAERSRQEVALQALHEEFESAVRGVSAKIREVFGNPRFREAMLWQNRKAYQNTYHKLMDKQASSAARHSKKRQYEELIAIYLQRYCVKNDTIGFFGPIGWASFDNEAEPGILLEPGPHLMATRNVYFEGWGIDALAAKLAADVKLRKWAAPRRLPYIRLEGDSFYLPASTRPTLLTSKTAAVLRACDSKRTAGDLAAQLVGEGKSGLKSEEEVYRILEALKERGLITWTFEIPLAPHPERRLQRLLEKIDEPDLREPALRLLADFEQGRQEVAAAAGNPERLEAALGALEESFTLMTGEAPTRSEGKTYAARTLVYEDGRRDVKAVIGPDVLKALAPPLSIVLASARWISYQLAALYRDTFLEVYRELARKTGTTTIDAMTFWMAVQPLLYGEGIERPIDALPALLQERWSQILDLPNDGRRHVEFTSEELMPRVVAAFETSAPGWKQAIYHSPDVMIAAANVEAIKRGEYMFVLGEVHLTSNTLSAALFVAQHPEPEALFRAVLSDFHVPKARLVTPKSWINQTLRTVQFLVPEHDLRVEFTHDSITPTEHAIQVSEVVVEEQDGDLIVRTRDGRINFELLEAMGEALSSLAVNSFRIMQPSEHNPRVTIDRMVVSRESWSVLAEDLEYVFLKDEAERFLATRRWLRAQGLPRFAFIKTPVEVKPVFMDFASTIFVDAFTKLVRRTIENGEPEARIGFSEMLPGTDQTWLFDAEGNTYTSELRIVAVDLSATGYAKPGEHADGRNEKR
jgi:hypothetical protein